MFTIIVPLYNEEDNIQELYYRLTTAVKPIPLEYEILLINDGSKDNTLQKIIELSQNNSEVKYLSFSRNFGHQIAVTAGIDFCKGEFAVIIDGDLQDPPELIVEMYEKYKKGYNVVYARRNKRKGESFFKKASAKFFYRLMRKLSTVDFPIDVGDFRLIDRKIIDNLKLMPEKNKFLRGQIAWIGFKQTFVAFDREERKYGKTGYPLKKMISFALDGITGFSDTPLRFVTNMGIFVSSIAFAIIIYAVVSHLVYNQTITGWTSIIVSSMFMGGVQLISIGIIGEYVSRINRNIQNRPTYIIDQSNIN